MASTGEVACLGSTVQKTYLNSLQSAGFKLPAVGSTILLSTGPVKSKAKFLKSVILLRDLGYSFYATRGTAEFLHQNGVQATIVGWPDSDKKPNALECIRSGKVSLVINIPKSLDVNELSNDFVIRRAAVDSKVPLITDVNCAILFVDALKSVHGKELKIKAWKEYVV